MVKFSQVVMGPAGSGKSTYCAELQRYCNDSQRTIHIVNLDPAAECFQYSVSIDIRDLICVDDAADDLEIGPNGALVYCMEHLLEHLDWLEERLEGFVDNDYIVFDLPGQIELYTHFPFMKTLVRQLEAWDFRIQGLYMLDSQFMSDPAKFFGGSLTALSAMIQLEVPHVNVLSKMDLVKNADESRLEDFLHAETSTLVEELAHAVPQKFLALNVALGNLIDEFGMVQFVPLDVTDDESIACLLLQADLTLQYDEEVEPRLPKDDDASDDG